MTVTEYLIEKYKDKWLAEGVGMVLVLQLERKFKVISDAYRECIQRANSDDLLKWSEKVLDSQTIEEVFIA